MSDSNSCLANHLHTPALQAALPSVPCCAEAPQLAFPASVTLVRGLLVESALNLSLALESMHCLTAFFQSRNTECLSLCLRRIPFLSESYIFDCIVLLPPWLNSLFL